jgi:uncharacterized membrane protein
MPSLVPEALHPILVHLPIVLLPLSAVLATFRQRLPWAAQALPFLLALAGMGAVAAAILGALEATAWEEALGGRPELDWLTTHKLLGLTIAIAAPLLALGAYRWRNDLFGGWRARAWPLALWTVTLLVAVAAWYGGAVVHET